MLNRILSAVTTRLTSRACVLMYHRVASLEADVWKIAVDPIHFEQQIQFLKQKTTVISVDELAEAVAKKAVRKNTVAITFDDGYADNFLVAKPILDQYNVPATFFVTSQTIGKAEEFWWDELEYIFLFADHLPATFSHRIADSSVALALVGEEQLTPTLRQKHQSWDACIEGAPSLRASLFLEVWRLLRPLPYPEQQEYLRHIRKWAGLEPSARTNYRAMSVSELQELSHSPLHSIGIHTLTHPALAFHSADFQRQELLGNKHLLEQQTGRKPNMVAYPYGNYNPDTLTIAAEVKFSACFTTEETSVTSKSDKYRLGRFQVKNSQLSPFAQQLRKWQKGS